MSSERAREWAEKVLPDSPGLTSHAQLKRAVAPLFAEIERLKERVAAFEEADRIFTEEFDAATALEPVLKEGRSVLAENASLRARLEAAEVKLKGLYASRRAVFAADDRLAQEIAHLNGEIEKGQAYERQAWLDLEAERERTKALSGCGITHDQITNGAADACGECLSCLKYELAEVKQMEDQRSSELEKEVEEHQNSLQSVTRLATRVQGLERDLADTKGRLGATERELDTERRKTKACWEEIHSLKAAVNSGLNQQREAERDLAAAREEIPQKKNS